MSATSKYTFLLQNNIASKAIEDDAVFTAEYYPDIKSPGTWPPRRNSTPTVVSMQLLPALQPLLLALFS